MTCSAQLEMRHRAAKARSDMEAVIKGQHALPPGRYNELQVLHGSAGVEGFAPDIVLVSDLQLVHAQRPGWDNDHRQRPQEQGG